MNTDLIRAVSKQMYKAYNVAKINIHYSDYVRRIHLWAVIVCFKRRMKDQNLIPCTAPSKPDTRPTQRLSGPTGKTIRCNLTSSVPDDGRMYPKHVDLKKLQ